jgi:AraC-like DNA-binding protein
MFLNVISLLVGFLSLVVVALMLCNQRANSKINIYLIIILFVAGSQRFVNAIEVLGYTDSTFSPLKIRMTFAFFIIPFYYLFFKRLIRKKNKHKNEILHFILPTIFVAFDLFVPNYPISYYWYLVFSVYYFISIILLVKELFQLNKLSILEKRNYKTIQTWAVLMTTISFLLVVYSNYFLLSDKQPKINLNVFYRISSLLWLGALIYMFRNPSIIFGEHYLLKNIQKETHQDILIWSDKPIKEVETKDKLLFHSIVSTIDNILLNIKKLQKNISFISATTLTAKTIAQELKLPKSHLELVFKYYCHYSINDFGNLVKIIYALQLINEGYLKDYTVESLGEKCLFNSRFTFSKNFKKFIGVSVSDYTKEVYH